MKYIFILIIPFIVFCDEGDIVERKIINHSEYQIDKESYCREKTDRNELDWYEDFDQNILSNSTWNYSVSNGFRDGRDYVSGWGNGEIQYYTKPSKKNKEKNTSENLFIENGYLKIQATNEWYAGFNYTSARINTLNLREFTFPSIITICFKVPKGIGQWPAFWLMPNEKIMWPRGGEIDILENRGRITNISSSALHFGKKYNNKSTLVGEVLIPRDVNFQDKFHSITLVWQKDHLNFYLDKDIDPYFSVDKSHPEFSKFQYPFNREYYMILNVAVGGKYDNYMVDDYDFCKDRNCTNKDNPDDHRFLIDWIEYKKL
ncbi:MAG: hypothetical protein CMD58_04075 [Gammaproteobacteria bacterium]|nr:hypothetical protein [Gammaproteobacteria bacterium]|tara:strand:- start:711 stop:1661 length:951 start_codon:yes stop_codon:yes gene_type:complete